MAMHGQITAEAFTRLSPWEKGYIVYMIGMKDDQPNVPEIYEPTTNEIAEYESGKFAAVLAVIDTEG